MKTGLVIFISLWVSGQAQPAINEKNNSSCCIEMTPEKVEEIHQIGEEVNNFIQDLSIKHEDLDFTNVELKVEQHSDDEHEDKEIMLKILVNDCKSNKNLPEIGERYFDHYDTRIPKTEDTRNNSDSSNKDGGTEVNSDNANDKQIHESTGSDSKNEGKNNNDDLKAQEENNSTDNDQSDSTEDKKEINSEKGKKVKNNDSNKLNGRNYISKKGGNKDDLDLDDNVDQQDGNADKKHKLGNYYENSNLYIFAPTYHLDSSSFEDPILQHFMSVEREKLYRKYYDLRLQNLYGNYPGGDHLYYIVTQPFSNNDKSPSSDNMMHKVKTVDIHVNGVNKPHGESGSNEFED